MTLVLANVAKSDGADNLPGIQSEILYNVKSNLTAIPGLPASPTTDAEQVTIEDDFTITATFPFRTLEVTLESGRVKSSWVGDRDGGQYKYTAEFLITDQVAAAAFGRKMANSRGYFVVTEMDGTDILLGDDKAPAYVVMEEYDGGQLGQEKGPAFKFMVYAYGATPKPPLFTGAAPIA